MLSRKQKWRMVVKRTNYDKIYQDIKNEERTKKNIVVFNNIVNVVLIPKIEESENLKEDYWWTQRDINEFKENYCQYLEGRKKKYSTI